MIRIQKILYPTDFSSYSNQAYFHAIAQAEKHGATLTVVFVHNPGSEPQGDEGLGRSYWRSQLEQIRPLDDRIVVRHVLLTGDPATEIVGLARDAGMDLIVMGTHGRAGAERQLMGSVAEKVLAESPCSVLVVKLPRGVAAAQQPSVAAGATR